MEYTKESLMDLLIKDYKDKLPTWYCQLNCFEVPEDFPIPLKSFESDRDAYEDPTRKIAWEAVSSCLGDEAQSKAWWTIRLGRTEEEWQTWWNNDCKHLGE